MAVGNLACVITPVTENRKWTLKKEVTYQGLEEGTHSWICVAAESTFNPALASLGPQSPVDAPEVGCPEAPAYYPDCLGAGLCPRSTQAEDWLSCGLLGQNLIGGV